MTDQQFTQWLNQLARGGAAGGAPSGGPGGGVGYQPPKPGGVPAPGGIGGGMSTGYQPNMFTSGGATSFRSRNLYAFDPALPPPADLSPNETTAPDLEPRFGGPGSYPTQRNFPHQAVDFPTGINVPHQPGFNVPGNIYNQNPAPNETMFPNNQGYFPQDNPPDFNNQYFPDTVYNPPPNEFMAQPQIDFYGGGDLNRSPNEGMYPNDLGYFPPDNPADFNNQNFPDTVYNPPTFENNYPNESNTYFQDQNPAPGETMYPNDLGYQDNTGGGFDFTAPPGEYIDPWLQGIPTDYVSDPYAGGSAPPAYAGTPGQPAAPHFFTPSTFAPSTAPPGQPGFSNMPQMTWDAGHNVYYDPNANKQGFLDELGNPTDWKGAGQLVKGAGQFFKDAAGNVVNAAGQIVQAAGNAANSLINNIMNDPGWSDPNYLASMGYTPGAGTGSWWPGQASNTNFGAGGEGGSFFGGTMNLNPMGGDISGSNNPFGAGQVGRSSVGPPQGGGGPPMWGPFMANSLGGNSRGLMLENRIRQSIMAGTYRPHPGGGGLMGAHFGSPVLEQSSRDMARRMGYREVSPGSFAPPGSTSIDWALLGQKWRDADAVKAQDIERGIRPGQQGRTRQAIP